MSCIIVYQPNPDHEDGFDRLAEDGHELILCSGREAMFDALAARRPDAIVYVLSDLSLDLGVLWLVRRIAATLPIILLGGPAGLDARRSVQELRPAYYGMFPLDGTELREAVRDVLRHPDGRALAS
jgi:hypothetical protein